MSICASEPTSWEVDRMPDLPKHKMTADQFLAWAEEQLPEAGKYELWDGDVVMRHGPGLEERSEHWEAKTAMVLALHDAIKRAGLPCHVASDGPMIRLSPSKMAKPDVLVYCGPKVPRGVQEVSNPLILVEVLSCFTKARDHGAKREGYFTLPSLHHYLIIDPDRRLLVHHRRGASEPDEAKIVAGAHVRLDPPGVDVDLTEVFGTPVYSA